MQIIINIEKRHLYVIVPLLLALIAIVLVRGYGGSNPAVVGHTASEIQAGWDNPVQGNFLAVRTEYDDIIAIGGDNAGNDTEIRIDAPAERNTVSFWNPQLGQYARIKVGELCIGDDCKTTWPSAQPSCECSGLVVGGGKIHCLEEGPGYCQCEDIWGQASCIGSWPTYDVSCPSGTTRRKTAYIEYGPDSVWGVEGHDIWYICVRN